MEMISILPFDSVAVGDNFRTVAVGDNFCTLSVVLHWQFQ